MTKRKLCPLSPWRITPLASFPNITISIWEYVITILCETFKKDFLSFSNVTFTNSAIIYSYEKSRLPILKSRKLWRKFIFPIIFIVHYWLLLNAVSLSNYFAVLRQLQCLSTFSLLFSTQKFNITCKCSWHEHTQITKFVNKHSAILPNWKIWLNCFVFVYELSSCELESHCVSDISRVLSKEFVDNQATIECRFTLKRYVTW